MTKQLLYVLLICLSSSAFQFGIENDFNTILPANSHKAFDAKSALYYDATTMQYVMGYIRYTKLTFSYNEKASITAQFRKGRFQDAVKIGFSHSQINLKDDGIREMKIDTNTNTIVSTGKTLYNIGRINLEALFIENVFGYSLFKSPRFTTGPFLGISYYHTFSSSLRNFTFYERNEKFDLTSDIHRNTFAVLGGPFIECAVHKYLHLKAKLNGEYPLIDIPAENTTAIRFHSRLVYLGATLSLFLDLK